MSRYYSFNDFMNNVIEEANSISESKNGFGLEELYRVKVCTYEATKALVLREWKVFRAVVFLFGGGAIGLSLILTTFLLTPIGLIVVGVLGAVAAQTIKQMYEDRILPQAVKAVGEKYKEEWENLEGNRIKIDKLLNKAALELYYRAFEFRN